MGRKCHISAIIHLAMAVIAIFVESHYGWYVVRTIVQPSISFSNSHETPRLSADYLE